jgi:hypothetical protein
MCVLHSIYKISTPPPPPRHRVKDNRLGGGNLQTDAAQLFLLVPIPAKAKKSLVFFQSINFLWVTRGTGCGGGGVYVDSLLSFNCSAHSLSHTRYSLQRINKRAP